MIKKHNTIFTRIMCLTLSTILMVSLIICLACIAIAKSILLKEVTQNAYVNLVRGQTELLNYNEEIANVISKLSKSKEFKNYITVPEGSTKDQINLIMDIGKYMDNYRQYLSPVSAYFMVVGTTGQGSRYYTSNPWKWDPVPKDFVENYLEEAGSVPHKMTYHSDQKVFQSAPYGNCIFVTKPLVDSQRRMYGYVVVVIDESYLYSKYSDYMTNGMSLALIESHGGILSSNDKSRIGKQDMELLEKAKQVVASDKQYVNVEGDRTIIALYLPFYDAYLVEEIDQKIVFASLYRLEDYMKLIMLVVIAITYSIVFLISRHITKPLHHLAQVMSFAATHDFKEPIAGEKGSQEMQMISEAYNAMLKDINHHVKSLLSEQEERRKAELNALQMQINPHFLYNTLSSIKYLAQHQQIAQVDETIDCLISILQSTIGTTDEMITIEEEIKNLGFYVYISQMRYGDFIKVDYQIDPSCYKFKIPKLMIQPFIENAFFHAFTGRKAGNISVFINQSNDLLLIEILDNGTGMKNSEEAAKEKKYHFSGIGIHNVDERIKLLYGKEYGVEVQSELGFGTNVSIKLPAQVKE